MAVYIEEQIHALSKMCEALVVHAHFTGGPKGELHEGHSNYPASGCQAPICVKYAEAYYQMHFGDRSYHMAQLRGENERLIEKIGELEKQLGVNQEPV
jgi:hypothetical protein